MSGAIVTCKSYDTVRVEVAGQGAVSVPAAFVLAAHSVMKHCAVRDEELDLALVEDRDTGESGWQAASGNDIGDMAASPWEAIVKLADELEASR